MKRKDRQTLALLHLKDHGRTTGKSLSESIGVTTKNIATVMKPLIAAQAVIKGRDKATQSSTYTITKTGLAALVRKDPPVEAPRYNPSDPFGLLAKLRAAQTSIPTVASHR
ncbi:hypothetical protein [Noviherbaspirillum denitrificans]|uniref:MarR family transcriptional regulator n=1 Tax=Noviherbaspirillum denitrificans TaxID=1968433 RepID=A0A254T9S8_9BURK|nr:hypothetical protein [Noviherbaspirillum denitrificans]OWW18432.1 hypothetical protein AYR66_01125 [Noviherbaspirillum denitrificans]OWW19396.1 hypothetical protein AYR66_07610 [Noviherbaspirillum denitrificans]